MLKTVFGILISIPLALILLHTIIRIVRHFYKFPMPQSFANLIDNPVRRKFQPPDATAIRHGIRPGMMVLEVGPGSGTYTLGAARCVGERGKIVTTDIEPKMIERVEQKARAEGITNIEARVADVYRLPFEDRYFDIVYMIAVIGEIPSPGKALKEFHRVLSDQGTLVFSEIFTDPDYPMASTLERLAREAGFRLQRKVGNFFYYTLIFEKASA